MGEQAEALKERARRFALATLRLIKHSLLTDLERLRELKNLTREADELAAIFSKSAGTARRNQRRKRLD
jgi:hypothetical protein